MGFAVAGTVLEVQSQLSMSGFPFETGDPQINAPTGNIDEMLTSTNGSHHLDSDGQLHVELLKN